MTEGSGDDPVPLARDLFAAISLARDLRAAVADTPERTGIADLAHSLLNPRSPGAGAVLDSALDDPEMAATLAALARRIAVAEFPAVAAASSGDIDMREQEGASLRLLPSHETGGPVYLFVEQPGGSTDRPRLLVGVPPEGVPVIAALPDRAAGSVQLLLDPDAPLLDVFRNPDSRFYLT